MNINQYKKRTEEVMSLYLSIKPEIEKRLEEFRRVWRNGDDKKIFIELSFCLLTPQSSAKSCWRAVQLLLEKDLLFEGDFEGIRNELNIVRFRNNKARYIMEARDKFVMKRGESLFRDFRTIESVPEKRDWLVKNVKGMGYKEASHFLRNIGMGQDIAILDRHILKNMKHLGILAEIPKSLGAGLYKQLEEKLRAFSSNVGIPLDHLDFVLWYKEAGEVFK